MPVDWDEVKYRVTQAVGAGIGITFAEFVAEFASRAIGWNGWKKLTLKTVIKVLLGVLLIIASAFVPVSAALILDMAGVGAIGSIALDVLYFAVRGGVWGLAEKAAAVVKARGLRSAGAAVAALKRLESAGAQVAGVR